MSILNKFAVLIEEKNFKLFPINHGRNSRVFRIEVGGEPKYCGKIYPVPSPGRLDRLYAERVSIAFLKQNGFSCIPKIINYDEIQSIAIFDWIDGSVVSPMMVTNDLIFKSAQFIESINDYKKLKCAKELPNASEACFSLSELYSTIKQRHLDLLHTNSDDQQYLLMRDFVKNKLLNQFEKFSEFSYDGYAKSGISFDEKLEFSHRILSPSDFGFHNALLANEGIYWLDFEYFGWDDPAKTLIDFIIHPAMQLSNEHKHLYAKYIRKSKIFSEESLYRSKFLFFLYGIKWCLIMLNEFLDDGIRRRKHSGMTNFSEKKCYETQLRKSQSLLNTLIQYDEKVPYF